LTIEPGKTVALVGPSGAGKSSVVSLIQRFYDPPEGEISLDGKNIKTLNLKWLRQQVTNIFDTIFSNVEDWVGISRTSFIFRDYCRQYCIRQRRCLKFDFLNFNNLPI
jgi:ABC-type transport system involved in Fe-S cluster assembly fused permease/ATPase subunit